MDSPARRNIYPGCLVMAISLGTLTTEGDARPRRKNSCLSLFSTTTLSPIYRQNNRQDGSSSRPLLPLLQEVRAEPGASPTASEDNEQISLTKPSASRTPSHGSTVVCRTPRSASSTWAASAPTSTSSPAACTWSPTSMSSCRPRLSRPPVSAPTSTW